MIYAYRIFSLSDELSSLNCGTPCMREAQHYNVATACFMTAPSMGKKNVSLKMVLILKV